MPRFKVNISQRMWNNIEVDAGDEDEARMKVYDLWDEFVQDGYTCYKLFTEGDLEDFQVEDAVELAGE